MESPVESLVDQLLELLDEQVRLLEEKRGHLRDLSSALIDRDESATESVLERMEDTERRGGEADCRLHRVRQSLGENVGCPAESLRLTALIPLLPAEKGRLLRLRRDRIAEQADHLRREHLRTVMLLNECVRINRMLLETLVPGAGSVTTYGTGGADFWSWQTGLVDTES